jgi:hypothetical protein
MKDARNQEERRLASELAFVFLSARSDLLDACFTCFADLRVFIVILALGPAPV